MASIFGHAVSAFGFSKILPNQLNGTKILFLGILCSIIPDIDFYAESFGITAMDNFGFLGHRGITHSFVFALVWSVLIYYVFHKKDKKNFLLVWSFYLICTASHGILDSMTTGGDGIGFLMPFDNTRSFFPFRFIEVSPLGFKAFLGEWGLNVLWNEFKYIGIPSILLFFLGKLLNKKVY